jgi:hypothetical protein
MVICFLQTGLLGVPLLQAGQIDQGVVGTYHAEDMGSGELPGVLHKLLEPAPRLLCFLNRSLPLRAVLVLGEFRTDQF